MHRPEAIANEFLRRRGKAAWPQQMYLQKLVYIAHGWNLAINEEPLVNEAPEAWDNGPVFRSLWNHIRDHWYSSEDCLLRDPDDNKVIEAKLLPEEKEVIDHVWSKYSQYSAEDLSKMTHEPNTPWHSAYLGRGRNSALEENEIRNHYTQLAMVGRSVQQELQA